MVDTDNAFDRLLRDEKNGRGPKWKRKKRRKDTSEKPSRKRRHWRAHLQSAHDEIGTALCVARESGNHQLVKRLKALRAEVTQCLNFNARPSYAAYMASPAWTAKRISALEHYGAKCNRCGSTHKRFNVHHKTYKHLGDEPLSDLEVLCVDCHAVEHEAKHGPGGELYEEFRAICG